MSFHVHPIRVLVVDDSAFMRNRLSMMLMKCQDMQVVGTAKDGHDAIEQVQRTQPDVVTLDIEMPGMNGLATLSEIRKRERNATVVMITAYATIDRAVQAMKDGAFDFVTKPFEPDQIAVVVEKALERESLKREVGVLLAACRNENLISRGFQTIFYNFPGTGFVVHDKDCTKI